MVSTWRSNGRFANSDEKTYGTLEATSVTVVPVMLIAEDLGPRGIVFRWRIMGSTQNSDSSLHPKK